MLDLGDAVPVLTSTITGFVNGETLATSGVTRRSALATTATSSSPVGNYAITASQGTLAATNYVFAFGNGTLTVGPASLTVTADNKTKQYSDPLPAFTASYSGFKNGETLATSGVTGSPSVSTTATTSSKAGTYAITATQGSLSAANYSFLFVNGTLTIAPATPTVSVTDAGDTYNGQPFPATATVAGVVAGVDNTPSATLEGIGLSLAYYAGSTASGTALSGFRWRPAPTPW